MATVKTLVVAGGGGGGRGASAFGYGSGGGGAGGFQYDSALTVTPQAYTITVGAGGAGSPGGSYAANGGDSSLGSLLISTGGGGAGGNDEAAGHNGGSGAGGNGDSSAGTFSGGTGVAGQGNAGGTGTGSNSAGGGGGGGASAAGGNAGTNAGAGGAGTANSISGASVTYAGGGGGSIGPSGSNGAGGAGGGGAGGTTAVAGTANTGGGGGGTNDLGGAGAAGGSGIVIISYATDGSDGVSPNSTGGTMTINGDQTVHTFTSSGTWTMIAFSVGINFNSSNTASNTGATSLTFAIITGAITNGLVIVAVSTRSFNVPTSVTFDGVAMTLDITSTTGLRFSTVWHLVLGTLGAGSRNVVITDANADRILAAGYAVSGADQTTPLDSTASAAAAGNVVSATITTIVDGSAIFDAITTSGNTPTMNAQTNRLLGYTLASPYQAASSRLINKITAGGQVMDWQIGGGENGNLAIAAYKPAAAPPGTSTGNVFLLMN